MYVGHQVQNQLETETVEKRQQKRKYHTSLLRRAFQPHSVSDIKACAGLSPEVLHAASCLPASHYVRLARLSLFLEATKSPVSQSLVIHFFFNKPLNGLKSARLSLIHIDGDPI